MADRAGLVDAQEYHRFLCGQAGVSQGPLVVQEVHCTGRPRWERLPGVRRVYGPPAVRLSRRATGRGPSFHSGRRPPYRVVGSAVDLLAPVPAGMDRQREVRPRFACFAGRSFSARLGRGDVLRGLTWHESGVLRVYNVKSRF